MKIQDVRITSFRIPLPGGMEEVMIKGQSIAPYVTDFIAVEVVSDDGLVGEAVSPYGGLSLGHSIADRIRPFVLGQDPGNREAIWQELWKLDRLLYSTQFAIGTVDLAIWDLYCKSLNEPLYRVLGGVRDKVPAYASGMTLPSPRGFAEDALKYKEAGYQGYKLHVKGEWKEDIAACRAVREAVGEDYPLMIDPAGAYTQSEALKVGRALEELEFHWYEEPLRDWDIHGYKMLADKLDIPLMALEVIPGSVYAKPEYIVTRAIDIVRGDISFTGGVTGVMKTARLAEAFGLAMEVHTNANSHIDAAHLHCIAAMHNSEYFEQLVPERFFHFPACEPVKIDNEGFVHLPDGPGIGRELDWDYIAHHKVAEL
ncbi:mandelate racemase [Amycolatopsis acidicola]|uniref:Mandelate racemase n=1 Tax=Amycolatopsis acidicola TaxID=2596893 RepID=A0A5N0URZ9_9PSEU|nr:enolase C-terminal domain-like protein [Amycolatopsis acidicola]KAA9153447.1 mandelate racemase [Amycolatopsis acidicola]